MARNHSLRPDSYSQKLHWFVGMKKHPDSQPCRAVPMDGGDDDDGYADEQFEGKGIYDEKPLRYFGFGPLCFVLLLYIERLKRALTLPNNDRRTNKVPSTKVKDQSPKTKVPRPSPKALSALLDLISSTYPGAGSTCDVEQICEAASFEQTRGRARTIATGADDSS